MVVLIVAASCSHRSQRAAPTGAPRIANVTFPALRAVNPGVLRDDGSVTATRFGLLSDSPGGLRLQLDRCELRAPGHWVVGGRVTLPAGTRSARATLAIVFARGDVGNGSWTHRVTFTGSGSFALAVASPKGEFPSTPLDDAFSDCGAMLGTASVPVATTGAFVKPSATRAPYAYSAPRDSIQALGIGAPLRDSSDPRTISLYSVWEAQRTPIATVWVPVVPGRPAALTWVRMSRSKCAEIGVAAGPQDDDAHTVTVWTRRCAPGDDGGRGLTDTHRAVEGAAGFTWSRPSYPYDPEIATRAIGDITVWVEGGRAVKPAQVAHVAATLTTLRNLAR